MNGLEGAELIDSRKAGILGYLIFFLSSMDRSCMALLQELKSFSLKSFLGRL